MKVLEKEGRTVDEAVDAAAAELGVPKTKLAIEILDVGTAGFFGMLSRKARVRVALKDAADSERESKERTAQPAAATDEPAPAGKPVEPFFHYGQEAQPWYRSKGKPKTEGGQAAQQRPAQRGGSDRNDRGERGGRGGRRERGGQRDAGQRRGGDRGRQGHGEGRPRREPSPRGPQPEDQQPRVALEAPPLYHITGRPVEPQRVLEYIVRSIVPSAEVTLRELDDQLWLDVAAGGRGIFIGHKGSTLEALQFIVNKIVRKAGGHPKKIVVDSEGYRQRRNQGLIEETQRLAERVVLGSTPLETEPLSAFDRRIVHLALRSDPRLTTRSLGSGEFKRVQILLSSDPAAARSGSEEPDEELEDEAPHASAASSAPGDDKDGPDGQGI